jgi:N-acetylmuramoyl-L-alanine amidase
MPIMTGIAQWQGPTVNMTPGGMGNIRMLVVHIQQGTNAGSIAWCKDPASQVSAHFFNPKSGALVQLVDTDDMAWAEVNYNPVAISVENEGYTGDSLTANQIENCAQVLAACNKLYGIPLVSIQDPSQAGVIGHGLLGAGGGNHPDCPGDSILAQRAAIIARAAQILGTTPTPTPEDDMDMSTPVPFSTNIKGYFDQTGGSGFGDVMASNFPQGGTAPFGTVDSWDAMSARAAYLKSVAVEQKVDALTALVQQLLAK